MASFQKAERLRCAAIAYEFASEYRQKAADQCLRNRDLGNNHQRLVLHWQHKARACELLAAFLEETARTA